MDSIWEKTIDRPRFDTLQGDKKTDVLIIGGGIAGVLCAYMLDKAGVDYLLVEASTIGGGVTHNTTAKITAQHGLLYDKLLRRFGMERAQLYLQANLEALTRYRTLCREIDCDYEEADSFVFSLDDPWKLQKELSALGKLGFSADLAVELPLPFPVVGAVHFARQAQFHPLKFLYAIAHGLHIFEHTKVQELVPGGVITEGGRITAQKIVVATHFPLLNKHGSYFLKQYQHRSYVLALKNAPIMQGMYVDEADSGLSFRHWGEYLLLGGGGHRTGKKGGGWQPLEDFARHTYPRSAEVCRWATQDCMTLDGVPYIGRYSERTPDLYVATGFNKWGMSSAMVAATLLTDLVQGKDTPYAAVFSPSRTILRPQLVLNAVETMGNLLTPTAPRCPHMGCALKWNEQERSWDCPCHGSRFSDKGKLLDNPATDDMKR